ncbi:hypothetical protein P7C70_g2988, partial [Phenoliferia sp. Uapishka_3]
MTSGNPDIPPSAPHSYSLYPGAGTTTSSAAPSRFNIALDPALVAEDHSPSLNPALHSLSASSNLDRSVTKVELGRTRCYWTIMTPTLEFVFADPILHTHLATESTKFIGSSMLDIIHPEEVGSLREDLIADRNGRSGGVENGGIFGSVTRCRQSRVSRIRRQLGCTDPVVPGNASEYVFDADYLEVQITTSWIGSPTKDKGNGLVLGFFHVTAGTPSYIVRFVRLPKSNSISPPKTDIDATMDANQQNPSGWTNWCGPHLKDGPYLDPFRCQQLLDSLKLATGCSSPRGSPAFGEDEEVDGPPQHVFQILDHTGEAIVSFPDSESGGGRSYDKREYAKLAMEVVARPRSNVEANTSCTRRYRSKHPIMKSGTLTTIESVVILYGCVTFAIFQTGGIYLPTAMPTVHPSPLLGFGAESFELETVPRTPPMMKRNARHLDEGDEESYVIERQRRKKTSMGNSDPNSFGSNLLKSGPLTIATSQPLHYKPSVNDHASTSGDLSPTVATASAILGSFSSTNGQHDTTDYSRPLPHQGMGSFQLQHQPHPLQQSSFAPSEQSGVYQQTHPRSESFQSYSSEEIVNSSSMTSKLPPLRPAKSRISEEQSSVSGADPPSKAPKAKAEPVNKLGPKACESCGTINSPEWRKGPGGVKSLCNACGLRYARSVARKNKMENGEMPVSNVGGKKGKAAKQQALVTDHDSSTGIPHHQPPESLSTGLASNSHLPIRPHPPHSQSQSGSHSPYEMNHNTYKAPPQQQDGHRPYPPYYSSHNSASPQPHQYSSQHAPQHQPQHQHQQPRQSFNQYPAPYTSSADFTAAAYEHTHSNGNGNGQHRGDGRGGGEDHRGLSVSMFGEPNPTSRPGNWTFPATSSGQAPTPSSQQQHQQPWDESWRNQQTHQHNPFGPNSKIGNGNGNGNGGGG